MILSMSYQVRLFLFTILIGAFLGIIYDIFRILRKAFKHGKLLTNIEDIIYWLFVTFVMFYLMLNRNYAEIRFFVILGAFSGMIVYFLTISRFVRKIAIIVIGFAIKIILIPLKIIFKILKFPVMLIFKMLKKILSPAKKGLQRSSKYAKIKGRRLKREIRILVKKI
ncbi:MAG: spore cortex biosynthesis protein YabQ [Defluviitaleaceae bacterium]|nr:spore cortex biosynthesis protein YabQ [Defluviitaleaceae bacterium]